jgi:hypothetical protein
MGALQAGQVGLVITASMMHLVKDKVMHEGKTKTKWNYEPVAKVTYIVAVRSSQGS